MTSKRVDLNVNTPTVVAKAPISAAIRGRLVRPTVIATSTVKPTSTTDVTDLQIHLDIEQALIRIGLYDRLDDFMSFIDTVSKSYGKVTFDTTITSDLVYSVIGKNVVEVLTPMEVLVVDVSSVRAEPFSALDVFSASFSKRANDDSTSLSDFATLLISPSYNETVSQSHLLTFDADRVVLDPVSMINLLAFNTGKWLVETFAIGDVATLLVDKPFSDTTTQSDLVLLHPDKGEVDSVTSAHLLTFDSVRVPVESFVMNETFNTIIGRTTDDDIYTVLDVASMSMFALYFDTYSQLDLVLLHPNKGVDDSVDWSSQDLLVFDTSAWVIDTIASTDDWAGNANVDDDQYVEFGKNTVDFTEFSEVLSTIFISYQSFADLMVAVDTATLAFTSIQADAIAFSSELLTTDATSVRADMSTMSDVLIGDVSSILSDTFSQGSLAWFGPAKVIEDSVNWSALLTFSTASVYANVVTSVDESTKETSSIRSDTSTLNDIANSGVDSSRSDTFTYSEIRTAWMQDYWSYDFNSTDYVGLSTAI